MPPKMALCCCDPLWLNQFAEKMHKTYYFCNPTSQKRPRLGLEHDSRFSISTSLICLSVAYTGATLEKYIPQKVPPVCEKFYILQSRLSNSFQNTINPFQKCSVSNGNCLPRLARQFLVFPSPAKTWQGFESSALRFQICLLISQIDFHQFFIKTD